MNAKASGAEAVQFAGKTLHSETAEVSPVEPQESSLRICKDGYFPVGEVLLALPNDVRSQVKARDFCRCGTAGHWQAALPG